jgi:hypothetical protein
MSTHASWASARKRESIAAAIPVNWHARRATRPAPGRRCFAYSASTGHRRVPDRVRRGPAQEQRGRDRPFVQVGDLVGTKAPEHARLYVVGGRGMLAGLSVWGARASRVEARHCARAAAVRCAPAAPHAVCRMRAASDASSSAVSCEAWSLALGRTGRCARRLATPHSKVRGPSAFAAYALSRTVRPPSWRGGTGLTEMRCRSTARWEVVAGPRSGVQIWGRPGRFCASVRRIHAACSG